MDGNLLFGAKPLRSHISPHLGIFRPQETPHGLRTRGGRGEVGALDAGGVGTWAVVLPSARRPPPFGAAGSPGSRSACRPRQRSRNVLPRFSHTHVPVSPKHPPRCLHRQQGPQTKRPLTWAGGCKQAQPSGKRGASAWTHGGNWCHQARGSRATRPWRWEPRALEAQRRRLVSGAARAPRHQVGRLRARTS